VRVHDGRSNRPVRRSKVRVDPLLIVVAAGFAVLATVLHSGFQDVARAVRGTDRTDNSYRQPATVPAGAVLPPSSAVLEHDREIRINEKAQDAMGKQREQYRTACWNPKPPVPGSAPDFGASLAVSLTFDADGHETRREISSAGGPANETILACARAQSLPRLQIPTQGLAASTVVGLSIP
jgi:hypothetical protein